LAALAPVIGSFLGVLVIRLPQQRQVLFGHSECDFCHHELRMAELIPIVSWIALRGHCKHCGARLGLFYPTVELAAIVVVLWATTVMSGGVLVATVVFGWILLCLALTDWRSFVLPDALTFILLASGLVTTWFIDPNELLDHAIAVLVGFAFFAVLASLYRRLRHREGLGLGDAKLLAGIGAWVSWQGLPAVVLYAATSGLFIVLLMTLSGNRVTSTQHIPFGTFLAAGGWLVWLYGPPVLH
jgi:leader peptidase (prepilin peptidase) / N-methyltransferase